MNNRNPRIPHRPTPNPRDQQTSADLLRQQIAQIYDEPQKNNQHHKAPSQESSNITSKNSVENPYEQTYNQQPVQYDWQSYHKAWQDYYQQYYHRYYLYQMQRLQQSGTTQLQPKQTPHQPYQKPTDTVTGAASEEPSGQQKGKTRAIKSQLVEKVGERGKKIKKSPHFMPIVAAVVVGILFLLVQFEQTIIAQARYYISPGTITNEGNSIVVDPTISTNVGSESRLIIPRINVDAPVKYVDTYDEATIQEALDTGVVHYANTALPGEIGNDVILGHSSHTIFNQGEYKFVFVLLDRLEDGDTIIQNYEGKRYVYKVFNKQVIEPNDFSLVNIDTDKPVITLITCTPAGTALRRLVVQAEQISPDPDKAEVAENRAVDQNKLPATDEAPSLTDRIGDIF